MLLKENYKTLSAWKKPDVSDYDSRYSEYIFIKKFKGLIQYPIGQYYSKLLGIYDKETIRMSGILFAPEQVVFDDKMTLRNVDGTSFSFYSLVPINQNVSSIKSVGLVRHNEYRIEFLNNNIPFPTDEKGNIVYKKVVSDANI